jgi:type IV secretory pathway TrbL component
MSQSQIKLFSSEVIASQFNSFTTLVKLFFWLVIRGKFFTKLNLWIRRWRGTILCPFCYSYKPRFTFLFYCEYFKRFWDILIQGMKKTWLWILIFGKDFMHYSSFLDKYKKYIFWHCVKWFVRGFYGERNKKSFRGSNIRSGVLFQSFFSLFYF